MNKRHAFHIFGGPAELARLLGLRRQAVYAWPDELPQKTVDRLIGLAWRLDKIREVTGSMLPEDAPRVTRSIHQ